MHVPRGEGQPHANEVRPCMRLMALRCMINAESAVLPLNGHYSACNLLLLTGQSVRTRGVSETRKQSAHRNRLMPVPGSFRAFMKSSNACSYCPASENFKPRVIAPLASSGSGTSLSIISSLAACTSHEVRCGAFLNAKACFLYRQKQRGCSLCGCTAVPVQPNLCGRFEVSICDNIVEPARQRRSPRLLKMKVHVFFDSFPHFLNSGLLGL